MSEYLSPDEIPGKKIKWPYNEWVAKIPKGELLEITNLLNGRTALSVRSTIYSYCHNHNLPLDAVVRGDRVFVLRKAEATP